MMNQVLSQETDYIVTNIKNSTEKWFFINLPILPKVRENFTEGDVICKVEERKSLYYTETKISTEQDKRERPEDIVNDTLVFKRTLIGYYKCSDIKFNTQIEQQSKKSNFFKSLIFIFIIIFLMIGSMYIISFLQKYRIEQQQFLKGMK